MRDPHGSPPRIPLAAEGIDILHAQQQRATSLPREVEIQQR
jgi:hypothetical protein